MKRLRMILDIAMTVLMPLLIIQFPSAKSGLHELPFHGDGQHFFETNMSSGPREHRAPASIGDRCGRVCLFQFGFISVPEYLYVLGNPVYAPVICIQRSITAAKAVLVHSWMLPGLTLSPTT